MTAVDRMAEGYEPDFDIDYEVGRQGELWVARIIDALAGDRAEVKTDEKARETGNVYLEYECLYRGEWRPTGIATSNKEIWCHVVGETVIAAPLEAVRTVARFYYEKGDWYRRGVTRGSHPTHGVCVPLPDFLRLLITGVPEDSTPEPLFEGTER